MYAIVKVGGRQFRVEKGDSIVVDRLRASEGDKLQLQPLLFRPDGKDDAVFETAELDKVKVEAVVRGHERGPKLRVLKFKAKKGYKRRSGHRSELTRLEIGDIKLLTRRPAGGAKKEETAEQEEAKERAAQKPAAKKPAAKKPAAKKPAARKPAAKKETDDGS
jgi:large subunit ribosomal protein L21